MEIRTEDIAKIPWQCIRRPQDEFIEVWRGAEAQMTATTEWPRSDWFIIGVVQTCRWLGGMQLTAPATLNQLDAVIEERVAEETSYAAAHRNAPPGRGDDGPGRMAGVAATLEWAWWRSGPSPVDEFERRRIIAGLSPTR